MKEASLKESTESSQVPPEKIVKLKKPAYFQMVEYPHDSLCEQLTFMLIRPPRFVYNPQILKPNKRNSKRFTAETINIGFDLTFYKQAEMRYVILYLHGNGSSRFEGNLFLTSLPDNVGLACFDFSGCGNRQDDDYITLGQRESKDVDRAARYLKQQGYRVVGWGRSMGAVSLLTSSECDIMVSDSAYSNLSYLCKQSSSKFLPRACCCIFHMCFPCIFSCIKCKVESMSGLEIDKMDIAGHLKKVYGDNHNKQICFIHGEEDTLIPKDHAHKLYEAFSGRKLLILFEGTHNSSRPDEVLEKCFKFIEESLNGQREGRLPQNIRLNKLVELQQMNKQFLFEKDKTISPVATSKGSKNSHHSERDITNIHLHSQYSNGPLEKEAKLIPEIKEEDYCQAGPKVEIILKQRHREQIQHQNFKSAASIGGVERSTEQYNSRITSSQKQEQIFRRIFKQD